MAREACAAHPPTSREPTPVRGVALVLGGQNPITLEYQIYPPPIDTIVTGMALSKLCTKRSRGCTWRAAHCVAREECSSHHGPYLPPQIPLKTHHFDAGQTHHSAHRAEAPQRKPGRGEDYIQKILVAHIICFEEK